MINNFVRNLERLKLNGKIKSIITREYIEMRKEVEIAKSYIPYRMPIIKQIFNTKGYLIESHLYDSDGGFQFKNIYEYNSKDMLIELRKGGLYSDKILFKYDNDDKLMEEDRYNDDNTLDWQNIFKYNNKNVLFAAKKYNAFDLIEETFYDNNGNEIEQKTSYEALLGWKKMIFDNKRARESIIFNNSDDRGKKKRTFKYDKKNNLIECCTYDLDSSLYRIINYKYNNKRNVIETSLFSSSIRDNFQKSFKYNKMGDLVEVIKCDDSQSVLWRNEYNYVYDKYNNWIIQYSKLDNKVVKREIEYYIS